MSIITPSATLMIGSFEMEQVSFDMVESSDATGDEAVRLFGPPRWRVSMSAAPDMTLDQASEWEQIVLQLRRGINHLRVNDPVRVAPQGTMRGTLTLNAGVSAGATTAVLAGASGTLKIGDWLQLGTGVGTSQLIKIMSNVTASSGTASITFEPSLRIAFSSGAAVTWDKPAFYGRPIGSKSKWVYSPGNLLVTGYALDLLESFSA